MMNIDSIRKRIRKLFRARVNDNLSFLTGDVYPISYRLDHRRKKYRFEHSYFDIETNSPELNSFEKTSPETLCRKIFDERRHRFIYEIFGIEPVIFEDRIYFDAVHDNSGNYRYTCNDELESANFKLISSVESHEYKAILRTGRNTFEDVSDDVTRECNLSYRLGSIDYFRGRINITASFDESYNIAPGVICEGSSVVCSVYALMDDNGFPVWVELILMSFAFDDIGNTRMAFFTAFSALDSFIEMQYEELNRVYKEQIMKRRNEEEVFDYLHERYTRYSNFQRRLIKEKYKDILSELTDNNYPELYNSLYMFEDVRHKIAHGEHADISREDFMNLVYTIVNVLYVMKYDHDVTFVLKKAARENVIFSPFCDE